LPCFLILNTAGILKPSFIPSDEDDEDESDLLPDTLLMYRHFLFRTSTGDRVPADVVNCNIQVGSLS
jgi:hypothetical protein